MILQDALLVTSVKAFLPADLVGRNATRYTQRIARPQSLGRLSAVPPRAECAQASHRRVSRPILYGIAASPRTCTGPCVNGLTLYAWLAAIYPPTWPAAGRHLSLLAGNVTASAPNHIWGIDITDIRLRGGWMYLVAILDWYSRYVVSWELDQTMHQAFRDGSHATCIGTSTATDLQ